LLGALYPAWMASHVSPLQAMAYRARPPRVANFVVCTIAGLILIGAQLGLMTFGDATDRFYAYAYAGLPALLLGYFILAIPLLVLVATLIGPPLAAVLRLPA